MVGDIENTPHLVLDHIFQALLCILLDGNGKVCAFRDSTEIFILVFGIVILSFPISRLFIDCKAVHCAHLPCNHEGFA